MKTTHEKVHDSDMLITAPDTGWYIDSSPRIDEAVSQYIGVSNIWSVGVSHRKGVAFVVYNRPNGGWKQFEPRSYVVVLPHAFQELLQIIARNWVAKEVEDEARKKMEKARLGVL